MEQCNMKKKKCCPRRLVLVQLVHRLRTLVDRVCSMFVATASRGIHHRLNATSSKEEKKKILSRTLRKYEGCTSWLDAVMDLKCKEGT